MFSRTVIFWKEFNSFQGLQKILGLKKKIKRIEGYDISNIQGKEATGSMVVFENGKPAKDKYRKFKIRLKQTPNDVFMLKEVLSRRLKHADWPLPEVMLMDGGRGQLNAGLNVKCQMSPKQSLRLATGQANVPLCSRFSEAGKSKCKMSNLEKTRIIAIAKRENKLFIEGKKKPVLLRNLPPSLANLFLQIRDEAHRFAFSYHRRLRRKSTLPNS